MDFAAPLVPGTLIKRYKRFLADITLKDGQQITCSVPNTGSMAGLTTPGSRVWLSTSDNPKRKYRHTLELVEADGTIVGINTGLPNRLAEEAISKGLISDLKDYATLKREQKYGVNSRIDILLDDEDRRRTYVEVKNVHFIRKPGLAEFPDSVTARGAKHLVELSAMVAEGHRAIMVYLIQREDCESFSLSRDLDPAYGAAFDAAQNVGVEAYAVRCHVSSKAIVPMAQVPIEGT